MAASTSDVEAQIRQKLPEFDDFDELLPKLRRLGVLKLDDLKHVEWTDIVPPLTTVQAKRLLEEFSGNVSARDEYKIKQGEQYLRYLKLKKDVEKDKMDFIEHMGTMRVGIHKEMVELDKETRGSRARASEEVSAEDTQRNVGAGVAAAGLGAAIGLNFIGAGAVGAGIGAAIGGAIGGGLGALIGSQSVDLRQDQKVQKVNELVVDGKKKLQELDKDIERQAAECKLEELDQMRIEFG